MNSTANQVAGDGNINDSECRLYNDFAQLTQSYQAHGGTVNTATTPKVQYSYADGSSNAIRIAGIPELSGYDQLQRLQNLDRGTFNGTQTAITSDGLKKVSGTLEATPDNSNEGSTESSRHLFQHIISATFGQNWTLDEIGNWNGFKQDNTGSGTWNLDQTRIPEIYSGGSVAIGVRINRVMKYRS